MRIAIASCCVILSLVAHLRAEEPSSTLTVARTSRAAPAADHPAIKPIWPHETSDLKPDPSAVWGRLDNGLRYVIVPQKTAPGRPTLRLYMRVGSLMETDRQQGIAHFLEHMAFNGTKHFPAGETWTYLQRLGMSAGADANAATTFDRTVYQLELPRPGEEFTGEGLTLFRDVLDGMLLESSQIDRERRVVLSELRASDNINTRAQIAALRFMLPDALPSRRMPIGKIETVQAMSRQQFVDFYETWYTPGRATIVAAGAFDVKMLERLIREKFQDCRARRGEQPDPAIGDATPSTEVTAHLAVEKEAPVVTIIMSAVSPLSKAPDSVAWDRENSLCMLTNIMLNRRFDKLLAAKGAPVQDAAASYEKLFNLADANKLVAVCRPEQWQAAIGALEQELRQSLQFGFTETEFKEAAATALKGFQAAADQADTRQSSTIAASVIDSLANNEVFTHPADDLAIARRLLAKVTKEECLARLRRIWGSQGIRIFMHGNIQVEGDGPKQIIAAFHSSREVPVQPPAEVKAAKWAYTDFGPAGRIVHRQNEKDLGIDETTFANNVRLNVKRTDREKSSVRVSVRIGGGLLELPADKPGLRFLANLSFIGGGLRAHSLNELNRALTDRKVNVDFAVGDEAFLLRGCCASAALETELQLCAAYATAPGYRPEALDQYRQVIDSVYAENDHLLADALVSGASSFLSSGNPRFGTPPRETTSKLTLDDLKAWLAKPLSSGYMEVAIVGDVDPEQALALAAKTFGALPPRDAVKPAFAKERQVKFPTAPRVKDIQFVTKIPCAASMVAWPTPGGRDIPRDRRLRVLGTVLNNRLFGKIRQELGATYTPEVIRYTSDAYPDYGYLAALMTVDPKRLGEIGPLVAKIGGELAAGPIGDDEFQRAIKPELSSLDDLDNSYWLSVAGDCQEHPEFLAAARSRKADYSSITRADLEALAKQYLGAEKATLIRVAPAAAGQ